MELCDTGIIVAAINSADANNEQALSVLSSVRTAPVTTWPCLTEAMYLVGRVGQEKLMRYIEQGVFKLYVPTHEDVLRACALMRKYADTPMDFADASLVVAAEILGTTRILTFDNHFYVYLSKDKFAFEVIP